MNASLSHWNAGASTYGVKQAWNASANGLSGKRLPKISIQRGGSSSWMKMFDTNASGRMIAFAAAEADVADFTSDASAIPSAANDATPTRNVRTAAGIFAGSISRS